MARGKANFEQHLKKLITNLTGFEDSDDNFSLCWQFAQSNIKYHRFLDVDSHQLTRSVDGLITKLQVHSQNEKAESLRCLVDKFLDSPLSEKELTQSDLHYAIIQLLLNIGDSPTKTVYKAPPTKVAQDEEDDFDWTSHLLAGEDQGRQLYIESPELSSSEEDDTEGEKTDEDNPVQGKAVSFHRDVIDKVDDVNKGGNQHALVDIVSTDRISLLDRGSNWLEKNVVVQYWKGVSEHTAWTNHNESNLYADWECFLSRTNPLYSIPSDLKVTEWQLMRELLWMLSGVKELFICHYRNGRFFMREDLAMSHVTKESLSQTLELFFRHGAQVQRLHEFISDVTDNTCNNNNEPDQQVSQTYQAFAQWLSQFLRTLKTSLCAVEKRMVKQEETLSIYKLVKELQPWFTKLSLVYDVFYRGTNDGLLKGDNAQMSSHLLSVLYNAVLDNDGLDDTCSGMAPMMLTMWVETSRPYLDIIDEWITNGNLIDPRKEFLIQRNEVVKSLDENFWETAFSFHCPDSQVTSPDEELSGSEGQKECMETKSIGQQKSIAWAPKFLQPVLREVVLAGKSMELLQNLGRLGEVIGGKGQKGHNPKSWYCTFIESLIEAFGKTSAPSVDEGDQGEVTQLTVFTQHIKQQMRVKGTHDHLLQANFAAIFDANVVRRNPLTTNTEALVKCLSHVDLGGLQPIGLLLEQSLYPYIHRRYRLVCLKLVEILTQEYRLLDYLKSMRHFFLMEAGDSLFDFYTQLFSKVQSHGVWRDYYSLNLVLQEALQTHHPEELTRLTLDITQHSYKAKDSNPINAFDGLRLHYKVPWPLDIVISSKTQEIYNQIFIFLLQIKYAKYSVDRLQFTALERENLFKTMVQPEDAFSRYGNEGEEFDLQDNQEELPRGQRVHRMQLLRMRLINFVNSLHTFIMTRILHSTGLEFMAEIQNATDLDQIIGIHGGYALKIQDRCLQHRGVAFLKEAVVKLLNLCVIFSARWQHGVDDISSQSIESLETEFGKCVKFLSSFLYNVVQRGTFPHLEPLAFALANSLEQKVS